MQFVYLRRRLQVLILRGFVSQDPTYHHWDSNHACDPDSLLLVSMFFLAYLAGAI